MLGVKGYGFITRTGYDPEKGKSVKDPYLGPIPSLGACRPDLRRRLVVGDHIFVISGKIPGESQYVIGGFEVAEKIHARDAYRRFPEQRLHLTDAGELAGNVIVDAAGKQHQLDNHPVGTIDRRFENYIVGRNPIVIATPEEVARCREESLYVIKKILGRTGNSMLEVLRRSGARLDAYQIRELQDWLLSFKSVSSLRLV